MHTRDRNVPWVVSFLNKALTRLMKKILATTWPVLDNQEKRNQILKNWKQIPQMGPTCNSRLFAQRNSLPSGCTQTHFLGNIICAWVKIISMKMTMKVSVMMRMTLFSADHKLGRDCWLVLQTRGSLGLGRWPLVVLLSVLELLWNQNNHVWPLVVIILVLL